MISFLSIEEKSIEITSVRAQDKGTFFTLQVLFAKSSQGDELKQDPSPFQLEKETVMSRKKSSLSFVIEQNMKA